MTSTLDPKRAEHKHLNGRVHATSRTDRSIRSGDLNLNARDVDGVRGSYSIDPGDSLAAVVCALLLVPVSIACVVFVAALRAAGAK